MLILCGEVLGKLGSNKRKGVLWRMRRRFLSVFVALMMLSVLPLSALAAETLSGAKLYSINESAMLEYNVVHSADVSEAKIVDKTGNGIDTVAKLKDIMGVPDAPAAVLSTDIGERTLGKAVIADLTIDDSGKIANIIVTKVRTRPVVGISWKSDKIGSDYKGFAEAFERNGAFAVFLPQVKSAEEAKEVLSKINGLFETGGEDWNPALYGEKQTPHGSSGWNDARDTSDISLMQQAVAMDVPLLAVCRGEQGFNVAMGGGLIQDVPYYLGQKVLAGEIDASRVTGVLKDTGYRRWNEATQTYDKVSCEDEPHYRVQIDGLIHSGGTGYHNLKSGDNIGILTGSKWLYDIIGDTSIDLVATAHHQAIDPQKLGKGLTIAAYSSDGIVEAIEHRDSLFALAVQWHPERDVLKDTRGVDVDQDLCNAVLGALVKYAGTHADGPASHSSSSSGCNAGAAAGLMALLAMPLFFYVKKKR